MIQNTLTDDVFQELLDIAYDRVRERTADMISTEEEVDAAIAMHRDQIDKELSTDHDSPTDEHQNSKESIGDEWKLEGYLQAAYAATRDHLKGVYPDEAVEVAIAKNRHHLMRRHRKMEEAKEVLQAAFEALPPEIQSMSGT